MARQKADGLSTRREADPADEAKSQTVSRRRNIVCGALNPDETESSHPGVLTLARILGRQAARIQLKQARRGSVSIMALPEAFLVLVAGLCALLWRIFAGIR